MSPVSTSRGADSPVRAGSETSDAAIDDAAVDRDLLTRTNAHSLAAANLVGRNLALDRLIDHAGQRPRGLDGRG